MKDCHIPKKPLAIKIEEAYYNSTIRVDSFQVVPRLQLTIIFPETILPLVYVWSFIIEITHVNG